MKKPLLLLLLIMSLFVSAQKESVKISVRFSKTPIEEALQQITQQTEYRFYYVPNWLHGLTVSGNFEDVEIKELLEQLFDKTIINFYIFKDDRIALTRNNIIYDRLPEGFFGAQQKTAEVASAKTKIRRQSPNPVFLDKQDVTDTINVETVRIGKENPMETMQFKLNGYVRNKVTGTPIVDLSIIIRGSGKGTTTDENGYYELELSPGLNMVEARSLGFQTVLKNIVIYNDGQFNFELNESVERLEEVVVSAEIDKNVEEVTMGTIEISSEETKTVPVVLGERNLLKIATTLPGVTSAGEGATGFNVRGGSADQNLVIMDGGVIYNPTHFFGIFQALNPFTIEDLKIYKGSIPAEYGGRLSSVFEITNKDANTEEFAGEASIGPVTSNIALEIPLIKEKSSLLLGGRGSYSDWILRSLDEESLNNSQASFYDIIGKYKHTINENNELRVSGYYSLDAFSITSDSLYKYSNKLLSANWNHKFNEKNVGTFLATHSGYEFNIDFDGESNTDFKFGYRLNETLLKLKMKYLHNNNHEFDYGISTKLYAIRPGEIQPRGSESIINPLNIPKEKGLESAVFVSDTYKFSEKLLFNIGLRYSFFFGLGPSLQRIYEENAPRNEGTLVENREYDNNEIFQTYSGPEVRVSGRYFLGKDFSVKAAYNSTYQYIHTLSNNTTVSPIDTWKLSDINIEPQRAHQYALGFFKNIDGNAYELSLEGYYKRSNNNLDFKVGADLLLNETIETEVIQGEGKAYGIELLVRKNQGKFNGWLGYSYARSFIKMDSQFAEERVNNGDYFPTNFDRPHDFSLVTNYKFTRRFSLSANFVYQTGRPVTYPVGTYTYQGTEYAFYSDRNKFRIPDFYRLDLSFNVEGNHKLKKLAHSFWNISVYNVLGRNNPYSVFFVTEQGEIKALKSSIFAIPIPTITYNFKF
ncbi:carboxypeptidase-like regulatory domain-containing protein [Croceitalea sp. MTPC9]|uniref:TonB-dependent receptor n=1 Tax=unclassified Croceitalea TaxID=2632280 RepID=UPI002B39D744|nr:carboxypeptidase-like regulatory domain-containing protein [Croceitalea sp. MTPC6]GMN18226.1 carboxypeptidase-like regulatory domain-containing protein [Croceitalea sp. MTPC9]